MTMFHQMLTFAVGFGSCVINVLITRSVMSTFKNQSFYSVAFALLDLRANLSPFC